MIKLGTLFSGIGAIEQAFLKLNIPHKIMFAVDNGERELPCTNEEIEQVRLLPQKEGKQKVDEMYNSLQKPNYMELTYKSNYNITSYFVNELFLNCYKRTKKANDLYFDYIAYKNYLEEIDTLGYDKNDINTYITKGLILKTTNTNLKLDQGEFPYKLNKAIVRCVKKANDRR